MRNMGHAFAAALLGLGLLAACKQTPIDWSGPPAALEPGEREGPARGYPALRTLEGAPLADGEFTQRSDGERLEIEIRYDFGAGHVAEERAVIRQVPELVQEWWSWREHDGDELLREFEIDFRSGSARARKRVDGELREWTERVELPPGRSFAGAAFALVLRSLHERLQRGETFDIATVGFTPKPRAGTVELSYAGLDRVAMSGRTLLGAHYVLHPKLPPLAKLFVDVPDTQLWLTHPAPVTFLRLEGPLAEPSDPVVRVDLLPGEPSLGAVPQER